MGQKNSNYEEPLDREVARPPPHKTVPPPPLPCGCDRIVKDATLEPKPLDAENVHPVKYSPNHGEYIDVTGYPPIVKDTIIY
jgi:hypothetical protein